jgi:AMIN domain-containing protein
MKSLAKAGLACAFFGVLSLHASAAVSSATTIRSVVVLGAGNTLEVEVIGSGPITPQAQVVTGPDRVILDFPNTVPDAELRNQVVNRGELKGVRVGRFSDNPPVTRVVLDLKTAHGYQLFPSGKTVIVKLASADGTQSQPIAAQTAVVPVAPPPPPAPPPPRFRVTYTNNKLKVWADKATLAEVLNEVRHRTGADVIIPPGAGQEPIVADLGPAPAREVLSTLLNGSSFNFVIVGSDRDSSELRGVFLTMRNGGGLDSSIAYPAIAVSQAQQPEPDMPPQPDISETPVPEETPPAQPDMGSNQTTTQDAPQQ